MGTKESKQPDRTAVELAKLRAEIKRLKQEQEEDQAFFAEERAVPKAREYHEWTFACPGKSLQDWNDQGRKGALDGPLVAVNSAIGVVYDADVWLITRIDVEQQLRDFGMTIEDVISRGIPIWAPSGTWETEFVRKGRDTQPDAIRKQYSNRQPAMEKNHLGFPTRFEWSQVGALGGVAIAIQMGAKHIRMFGMDMSGTGYAGIPTGPNAWREDVDAKQHGRWLKEKGCIEKAILDCADGGVLLQIGDEEAEIPNRTAPMVGHSSPKREDDSYSRLTEAEKKVAGNPTMRGKKQDAQTGAAIQRARSNIKAMAQAENAARAAGGAG